MKICVIGGTGHIGSFLTPMLVGDGHEVTVLTRGTDRQLAGSAWSSVTFVTGQYSRDDSAWGDLIKQIAAEVVIDIVGADLPSTYTAAKQSGQHVIACGSLWMFGPARLVPTPPVTQGTCSFPGYAKRYDEMQQVQDQAARDGIAFSAIMPPNIAGPGKIPLEGMGGRGIEVHRDHQRGQPVPLPHGCNTLIGPCDAEDIARAFWLAVNQRDAAAGELFNVGSAYALPAPQFVEAYAAIYGQSIPIRWVESEEYRTQILPDLGSHAHFYLHMCPDIAKLRTTLGYEPQHTPEATLERAVAWMRDQQLL